MNDSNGNDKDFRLRQINQNMPGDTSRKILISGTPFETTPAHMSGWIEVMESDEWKNPPSARTDYPRMNQHRRDLVHGTSIALTKLGKEHDRLVRVALKHQREDEARKMHAENMVVVVRSLWVRRTGDSNFMGYDLVVIPANYHFNCLLQYPEQ